MDNIIERDKIKGDKIKGDKIKGDKIKGDIPQSVKSLINAVIYRYMGLYSVSYY